MDKRACWLIIYMNSARGAPSCVYALPTTAAVVNLRRAKVWQSHVSFHMAKTLKTLDVLPRVKEESLRRSKFWLNSTAWLETLSHTDGLTPDIERLTAPPLFYHNRIRTAAALQILTEFQSNSPLAWIPPAVFECRTSLTTPLAIANTGVPSGHSKSTAWCVPG